jgi:tetratricopeptide (TPR) repeat protein
VDSLISKGINQIYNIKFNEAERTFRGVMADYPNHPAGRFFLAMIDWWKILLDFDNEKNDDLFFAKLEDVIYQCDKILEKDPNNVDALFFKGGAIGFRGRLRANRDSWIKAADDGREALPLINHAYKLDPNNKDIELGFGIYNYYAAVIPEKYPFVKPLMIFFPNGDRAKGIGQFTDAAYNGKYARIESRYFLVQLYYQFEENMNKAEEFADLLCHDFPDNPQFERYLGRINVRQGDMRKAQSLFRDVYDKCNKNFTGYGLNAKRESAYYLGYYLKLRDQLDSAITYFKECEKISQKIDKGENSGFLINAILYLGNLYDQKNQRDQAIAYYKQLLDLRDYSNSHSQAKKYLNSPYGK